MFLIMGTAAAAPQLYTIQTYTSGSGTFSVPAGFNYLRVTVVGAGGTGASTNGGANPAGGGAGGGCAQSAAVLTGGIAVPVTYSVSTSGATTASFGAVSLSANKGANGSTSQGTRSSGGTASGGATNYTGGGGGGGWTDTQPGGGGGAAGPGGAGGNGLRGSGDDLHIA